LRWTRPADIEAWRFRSGEEPSRHAIALSDGGAQIFATLDPAVERAVARFVETHTFETARRAVDEVQRFVSADAAGGVLVIQGERS